MRQYKRTAALGAALLLAVLGPSQALADNPEFAHDEETWARLRDNVMEYDELQMLVEEYNPTYLNNQTTYRDNRSRDNARQLRDKQYESAMDQYDGADDLRSQAEELKDSGALMMPGMASAYAGLMAAALNAEQAALKTEQGADASYVDSEMERLEYQNTQNALIAQVQSLFASYHLTKKSIGVIEKNQELMQSSIEAMGRQVDLGMATQVDLLNTQQSLQSLESTRIQTQAALESLRQNLCLMTGWQYNDQPEIQDMPAADLARIDAMNPDTDVQTALDANLMLQYNRRGLTNMAEGSADRKNMERTIKNQEETIRSTVKNLYNDAIQKRTALQAAQAALESAQASMNTASTKLQLGMMSPLAYQQEEASFLGKQVDVMTADINLQQAVETYEWALKGYLK